MQKWLLFAVWIASTPAYADIFQPIKNSSYATYFYNPIGQSFTATASESQVQTVSFLTGTIINPELSDPTIAVQLRSGINYAGPVLGSQTVFSIPDSTPPLTWIDFVFASPISLTPGQVYTLWFSAINSDLSALSYAGNHDNPYAGGSVIGPDSVAITQRDLAFRVMTVPEPSGCTLCMVAGAILILRHRRLAGYCS
jgi:hypothetical protein